MIDFPHISELCQTTPSKIVMLVVDGLGGLPDPRTGTSELQAAHIPNLHRLARESSGGLTTPVLPGITPGSGPGHLALFGYDPLKNLIGRGVLEALGIGVELTEGDVAARGNFCTVDSQGLLVDRRAGRITSAESNPICHKLDEIQIDGVDVSVHPVKDYRFLLLIKGKDLGDQVTETDPQRIGASPAEARALSPDAEKTAQAANAFIAASKNILGGREKANMVLLRGFSTLPSLPDMGRTYKLKPAAIAAYPMYRGLAKLLGMKVIPTGSTFDDEIKTLREIYEEHDFFYIHYKPADAAGEDRDFEAKVKALESLDTYIPRLLDLNPDVFVVAGDHSTPAIMGSHSWHPVPILLHSDWTKGDGLEEFSERACALGSLGRIPATYVMLLVLAHAGKLAKFGP